MRVYEAIVRGLEGVGVDAAFGGAGENAAGLMLALKHSARIRPVITRHEQAASFMACGYAMFTGRLGVCFATAGPGAFNLFSGLAAALSDSCPVLAISGYASLDWKGKGSLNETSGVSRTPDSQAMFAATTKKSFLLDGCVQDLRRAGGSGQSRLRGAAWTRFTSTSRKTSRITASRSTIIATSISTWIRCFRTPRASPALPIC